MFILSSLQHICGKRLALRLPERYMANHNNGQCGLVVHTDYPDMAASPDGIVSCSCCGNGVIKIKCPYNSRYLPVLDHLTACSKQLLISLCRSRISTIINCKLRWQSVMYNIATLLCAYFQTMSRGAMYLCRSYTDR